MLVGQTNNSLKLAQLTDWKNILTTAGKKGEKTRESLRVRNSRKTVKEQKPFAAFIGKEIEGH